MSETRTKNIDNITQYISSGIKTTDKKMVGVECEHIITDRELNPVSYYGKNGIEQVLEQLSVCYQEKTYSEGHLVGLSDGYVYITLEPAAQLEVSIIPFENLREIEDIYNKFVFNITPILNSLGYLLLNVGYHPGARSRDLDLIPKQRYRLMDSYFRSKGYTPTFMMRGSASVQINIDYFSEEDFVLKFRLANLLTPLFYLITDNSFIFECNKVSGYSVRSFAWENVDDSRCGFLEISSFREYAQWIYSVEPIFIRKNEEDVFCGFKSNSEIFDDQLLTDSDIRHITSMVFPNVRVKQFIEIRAADSLPSALMFAYAALIKGLFYNSEAVKELNSMFSYVSTDDMMDMIENIRKNGFDCKYYGFDFDVVLKKLFEFAENGLCENEIFLLKPLKDLSFDFRVPKQLFPHEVINNE